MDDLISRQAVLDGLASIAKGKAKSDAQKSLMGRVMFFTEQLPSAQPERKKGRWIDQDDGAYYPVECSECRKIPLFDVDGDYRLSNFCPNCGADMRGEQDV